ncbi:MAG: hypothetical protein AB7F75_03635 [Planctomycetota bacterium]
MTWIVRNTLRGAIELHGFLPLGQAVRVAGGGTIDLDTLSQDRSFLESSRQLKVAFQEGYLQTEMKNDDRPAQPEAPADPGPLAQWQRLIQEQLQEQGRGIARLSSMMETLLERVSAVAAAPAPASQTVRTPEPTRHVRQARSEGDQEARNRARLLEGVSRDMDVEVSSTRQAVVKEFAKSEANADRVDLLSSLDGFDG